MELVCPKLPVIPSAIHHAHRDDEHLCCIISQYAELVTGNTEGYTTTRASLPSYEFSSVQIELPPNDYYKEFYTVKESQCYKN